jgi:hypothetical protein
MKIKISTCRFSNCEQQTFFKYCAEHEHRQGQVRAVRQKQERRSERSAGSLVVVRRQSLARRDTQA